MSNPLVIYHDNCVDGFAAAWAAQCGLGDCELFPAKYGDTPPYELAHDREVFIVDFSYPREQLERLVQDVRVLQVLDHHKTAEEALRGLDYCIFDMNRSGCMMAWNFFQAGVKPPPFLEYIQDRDLWRWALADSKAVNAYIGTVEKTISKYNALAIFSKGELMEHGWGAVAWLEHYAKATAKLALRGVWGGTELCIVNASPVAISETLNECLEQSGLQLALGWYLAEPGLIKCSLRSRPGFDCSAVAQLYGGGGHAQASGFVVKDERSCSPLQALGVRELRNV